MLLDPHAHEWGRWCVEVMEALGLLREGVPRPLHVGVSMGGSTILDLAGVGELRPWMPLEALDAPVSRAVRKDACVESL